MAELDAVIVARQSRVRLVTPWDVPRHDRSPWGDGVAVYKTCREGDPMIGAYEIDALDRAMRGIAAKQGPFTLFALFRREAYGPWDLVVSADWLERGKLRATGELLRMLVDRVGEELVKELGRIQTVSRTDTIVAFFLQNFPVHDHVLHLSSTDLEPFDIREGIIFGASDT